MDKNQALQNLLNGSASEDDIELLMRLLASGEISIGGNVNQSVIIIGSGNTVELPPAALDRLNARPMLGNLDRDLTGEEIAAGLRRLDKLLPNRAPVLLPHYKEQVGRLRPILKTEVKTLSEPARKERVEALAAINSICVEAVDISFNGVALGEEAPKYDARSPFRGLESFRPEDSEFFFGREALTEKLLGKIKAHSFLAVLGASGSGKSSLVMAGVIPALDLDYSIFRPGTNPLGELESAHGKSLIVVDQFEELFTLTRDGSTRKDFIARLLDESTRARIILTLRSDFLGEVGAYRTLSAEIQSHLEIIPPMDMDELHRAMDGQAGVVGLRFEADLSQQILDDVEGEPGAMPLLQHALWELWNRRHGRNLRASEYRAFGGVKQAITSTAEKVYAECSKPEQDSLRDIFLRLTRLDDGDEGRDTRRRVPLGDLISSGSNAASITLLLDKLANVRLIVKSVNDDKTEVEVAHEALIRHWERLRIWLNEDRDALRLRESVSESAKEWEKSGKHESLLNSRWVKLDEALLLAQDSQYRLTEIEQAYLKGCVGLRNREQRERERRLWYTVFASIVAAIVFLVLGGFGLVKSSESTMQADIAKKNETIAIARQLSAQAQSIFSSAYPEQDVSVLLAVQSMRMFPTFEAARILQENLLATSTLSKSFDGTVNSVVFSNDGQFIVSGGCDRPKDLDGCTRGEVLVWVAKTGEPVIRIDSDSEVKQVVISPDNKYVAFVGTDDILQVWDADAVRQISSFFYNAPIFSIQFIQNHPYVAIGKDNSIVIIDSTTGNQVADLLHSQYITTVKFSLDGKLLVSGGLDGSVTVWDISRQQIIATMTHEIPNDSVYALFEIRSVDISPNGEYVVSGSYDKTVRVWEVATGKEIARMYHNDTVLAVSFSSDGKYVSSGSYDGTARLWDIATAKEIARLIQGHKVQSVSFSPDGKSLVSGGCDLWVGVSQSCKRGIVRIWQKPTLPEILHLSYGHRISLVEFSPDNKYIVSSGCSQQTPDGSCIKYTMHLWDLQENLERFQVEKDGVIDSVAFSADSSLIALSGCDTYLDGPWCSKGSVHILDTSTGSEIQRLPHNTYVTSLAFSEKGKYLISGGYDNTARIWDMTTGQEVSSMDIGSFVNAVAFSSDGKTAISSSDIGEVVVWDFLNTAEIFRFIPNVSSVRVSVPFSRNGEYIVTFEEKKMARIWNANTGKELIRIISDDELYNAFFSSDGKFLALETVNGVIQIYESNSGNKISRIKEIEGISSIQFSIDGKYILAGGCDLTCSQGMARVWEASTGNEIGRIFHKETVTSSVFSLDNRYVVSGSSDGQIRVWLYRSEDLINNACSRLTRNLPSEKWQQYIGDALPYQAVCPNLLIEP